MTSDDDDDAVADRPGGVPAADGRLLELLMSERRPLLKYIHRHFPASLAAMAGPEDVLHDTYYEAVRRPEAFDGPLAAGADPASVFRLLATIARRRMAQLLRVGGRTKRGGKSKRVGQSDSIVATLAELAVHRRTPSRAAASNEFLLALDAALARLPSLLRIAVTLRYVDGLTPEEIAGRMGRTTRAAHQLCYRGIQLVRRDLRSASMFV